MHSLPLEHCLLHRNAVRGLARLDGPIPLRGIGPAVARYQPGGTGEMSHYRFRVVVHAPGTGSPGPSSPALRVATALRQDATVVVVDEPLPDQAATRIHDEHQRMPFDAVIAADLKVVARLAEADSFRGRLWPLMTEMSPLELVTGVGSPELTAIAAAARFVLCPDELTRSLVDVNVGSGARRTVIIPTRGSVDRSGRRRAASGAGRSAAARAPV